MLFNAQYVASSCGEGGHAPALRLALVRRGFAQKVEIELREDCHVGTESQPVVAGDRGLAWISSPSDFLCKAVRRY
jgi:hypothetical protein